MTGEILCYHEKKEKEKEKKMKYSYALVKGQGEYGCRNYSTQHRRQYEFLNKRLKNYHIAILIQNFLFIIRSQYLGLLDRGEEVILEKLKIFLTFCERQRENGCRNYST